jgi:hypothetical protein
MIRMSSARRSAYVGAFALLGSSVFALAAPASATAPSTTPTPPKPCATSWPADVHGRPATFAAHAPAGAWMWHDAKGWHLRVTHASKDKKVFSGSVRSSTVVRATGYRLEGRDVLGRSADHKTIVFRFTNYGWVDGIDFTVAGCTPKLHIALAMSGKALPAAQIHLGADASSPVASRFTVVRS